MSKSKFVNIDESGNLSASNSSDALLQKVINDLAAYKKANDAEIRSLKANITKLQETCVKYKEGINLKMGNNDNPVSIFGGRECRIK